MQHYGLTQPLSQAGYYETSHNRAAPQGHQGRDPGGASDRGVRRPQQRQDRDHRRLQRQLKEENKITVSKSLSVEKHSIKLATLIAALYYDLATDKQVRIPKQGERRERELRELVRDKRPVALFVNKAHDLNSHTLTGLKRLMEVVEDGEGRLSVILPGHPKLRNDLRRPTMEEIGFRTDVFNLDGIVGGQREYIHWLISACRKSDVAVESILTADAINLLATRLRTPLQIQMHLTLALEAGYQTGEMSVSVELVESVLSRQLDDMEPTLTRHGYRVKDLVEQFDAKPGGCPGSVQQHAGRHARGGAARPVPSSVAANLTLLIQAPGWLQLIPS